MKLSPEESLVVLQSRCSYCCRRGCHRRWNVSAVLLNVPAPSERAKSINRRSGHGSHSDLCVIICPHRMCLAQRLRNLEQGLTYTRYSISVPWIELTQSSAWDTFLMELMLTFTGSYQLPGPVLGTLYRDHLIHLANPCPSFKIWLSRSHHSVKPLWFPEAEPSSALCTDSSLLSSVKGTYHLLLLTYLFTSLVSTDWEVIRGTAVFITFLLLVLAQHLRQLIFKTHLQFFWLNNVMLNIFILKWHLSTHKAS